MTDGMSEYGGFCGCGPMDEKCYKCGQWGYTLSRTADGKPIEAYDRKCEQEGL